MMCPSTVRPPPEHQTGRVTESASAGPCPAPHCAKRIQQGASRWGTSLVRHSVAPKLRFGRAPGERSTCSGDVVPTKTDQ